MSAPLVLVAGFGRYFRTGDNPSAHIATELEREPPAGLEVRAAVLPVTFAGVGAAWDALIARAGTRRPGLLLGLGMHAGASFRLERRARAALSSPSLDNAAVCGRGLVLPGDAERTNTAAWEQLAAWLRSSGAADVELSDDAGGFVCEASYHHLLGRAREVACPALFLHVPDGALVAAERQAPIVREFLAHWARAREA
jgi:pyrrolidone-carboxylate peptidase